MSNTQQQQCQTDNKTSPVNMSFHVSSMQPTIYTCPYNSCFFMIPSVLRLCSTMCHS